jgi:hypothetical protein
MQLLIIIPALLLLRYILNIIWFLFGFRLLNPSRFTFLRERILLSAFVGVFAAFFELVLAFLMIYLSGFFSLVIINIVGTISGAFCSFLGLTNVSSAWIISFQYPILWAFLIMAFWIHWSLCSLFIIWPNERLKCFLKGYSRNDLLWRLSGAGVSLMLALILNYLNYHLTGC